MSMRRTTSLLIARPKALEICSAILRQPQRGLRGFISTTATISSLEGPFGARATGSLGASPREVSEENVKIGIFQNPGYHLKHAKFYYQFQGQNFGDALLAMDSSEVLIQTLQCAVRMYRAGSSLEDAVTYSWRNSAGTGTQNLNFSYHKQVIDEALTRTVLASRR
jgi:hypothetical protein